MTSASSSASPRIWALSCRFRATRCVRPATGFRRIRDSLICFRHRRLRNPGVDDGTNAGSDRGVGRSTARASLREFTDGGREWTHTGAQSTSSFLVRIAARWSCSRVPREPADGMRSSDWRRYGERTSRLVPPPRNFRSAIGCAPRGWGLFQKEVACVSRSC